MSERAHHISDQPLSDVTFCIYKARRLPRALLTATVRAVFEPNEYPASIARLYATSPDEAIPEFYSQPSVFVSTHEGMRDMAVPDWADGDPATFVRLHRAALESEYVSKHLHAWIDVTFGVALSGEAAVAAKNVALGPRDGVRPQSVGRCQVFSAPHPPRSAQQGGGVDGREGAQGEGAQGVDQKVDSRVDQKVDSRVDSRVDQGVPGVRGCIPDMQAWMRCVAVNSSWNDSNLALEREPTACHHCLSYYCSHQVHQHIDACAQGHAATGHPQPTCSHCRIQQLSVWGGCKRGGCRRTGRGRRATASGAVGEWKHALGPPNPKVHSCVDHGIDRWSLSVHIV